VNAVIMNPPFTRQERIPEKYKQALDKRFEDYADYAHGQFGLHGYFMFLADSFLNAGGRMALVQPATILRLQSTVRMRKFLSDRYDIEYIITAWQKLAFSESAWIREILLVARKRPEAELAADSKCAIVTLKKMPADLDQADTCGEAIKKARETELSENEWARFQYIEQKELAQKTENWFDYISLYNRRIKDLWLTVAREYAPYLRTVEEYLKTSGAEVIRGIETRTTKQLRVQDMYILRGESHAIRPSEAWFLKEEKTRTIVAENRFNKHVITIPKAATRLAVRSQSGIDTVDLAPHFDYVVTGVFDGIQEMLPDLGKRELEKKLEDWNDYVSHRCGTLLVSRRFVLGVPGTFHLCYYGKNLFAGPGIAWQMINIPEEDAKILTLWMNSSLNFAQVLVNKIHDVWIDFHQYVFFSNLTLDPSKLSASTRKKLLVLFEEIRLAKFENLADQFYHRSPLRQRIDREILNALGATEPETESLLSRLYESLSEELEKIQQLMPGAEQFEEETN